MTETEVEGEGEEHPQAEVTQFSSITLYLEVNLFSNTLFRG